MPLRPLSESNTDFDGMTRDEIMENLIYWFLNNFEDPAENMPHESAEGGFQYIFGGPFDAADQIYDQFPNLPDDILEEVIRKLNRISGDWAPHSNRIDVGDREQRRTAYSQIQKALDELEAVLPQVIPISSSIGGNYPPESVGVPPYSEEDDANIKSAIALLRKPIGAIVNDPARVKETAQRIKSLSERILDFVKEQGKVFADAFMTEAGKRAAQVITAAATWEVFGNKLSTLYEALKNFLVAIGAH